jgi:D-alanine-D-alanine ligase-like ATP-grasp enzyme
MSTSTFIPNRICVLNSSNLGCEYEGDDMDPPADLASHLRRGGYPDIDVIHVDLSPTNCSKKLVELKKRFDQGEIDCFINLCDGAWDEPSCGAGVVDLLQNKLNVPFTGADLDFFEPTRLQMKQVALACGALVPSWRFIYNTSDLDSFLTETPFAMKFPLLVKHFSSYCSVGLTKESKVHSLLDLRSQCDRMLATYGGCLVEEFIEGREFTVLAAQVPSENGIDVIAFDPLECKFGKDEDFKHFNLKWVDYDNIAWSNVSNESTLSDRLKQLARNVFRGIKGRGYGRIDVRSDASGESLYFLEINPNCGVFYPEGKYGSADFILDRFDSKNGHANFLLNQVNVALMMWNKNKIEKYETCEPRFNTQTKSWGMWAMRDLAVGEVITNNEEKAINLVSKQHILKNWKGSPSLNENISDEAEMRCWENFCAYCWPVSDELFAMWSSDPSEWKPINHSCDPNAWNEKGNGLNVVARKAIKAGEEICLDYATFVGYFPEMKSFTCNCKSPDCRKIITGMDIIDKPKLALKYKGHMSSYVASKVAAAC